MLWVCLLHNYCDAPLKNCQQSNQIAFICSPIVRSENEVYHKSVVDVTEINITVCDGNFGLQQLQGSCQSVGTSTGAEKMLALNGNF